MTTIQAFIAGDPVTVDFPFAATKRKKKGDGLEMRPLIMTYRVGVGIYMEYDSLEKLSNVQDDVGARRVYYNLVQRFLAPAAPITKRRRK